MAQELLEVDLLESLEDPSPQHRALPVMKGPVCASQAPGIVEAIGSHLVYSFILIGQQFCTQLDRCFLSSRWTNTIHL